MPLSRRWWFISTLTTVCDGFHRAVDRLNGQFHATICGIHLLFAIFANGHLLLLLTAIQLRHFRACAQGEEAGLRVGEELFPGVSNVQIAHGELADAVAR